MTYTIISFNYIKLEEAFIMAKRNFITLSPMKSQYKNSEWAQREEEYVKCIQSLEIPFEPDDKDICALNAAIDQVYSIAKIEQAIYTRLYDKMYQRRKNSETEVYLIVKRGIQAGQKVTEAEMKGLGVEYLTTNTVDNSSYNIYQMVDMALGRKTFMDSVVDILKTKSDKMITASGALKLAVQINGNNSAQA